ncbi:MAG: tRNA pseudouridine(55) synthase TruB [Bacillaceae bacterium]
MNGVLLLNKPKGLTSHDCVFKIRKLFKTRKVGHTGTLDPEVTGVLPICIGRATKIVEFLTADSKTYEGEVTLGYSTTTEDAYGEEVSRQEVSRTITIEEILRVLNELTGEIQQQPPMFSAVKVNGKKLYEYARQGIEVERPIRTVTIHELTLLSEQPTIHEDKTVSFRFRAKVSKGTYIRTLAVQIGEKLGYPAHMSYLTRTASGSFGIDQCVTFEQIQEAVDNGEEQTLLASVEKSLTFLPKHCVDEATAARVMNGVFLKIPTYKEENVVGVYSMEGVCLAIYERKDDHGTFKPMKVLVNERELKIK